MNRPGCPPARAGLAPISQRRPAARFLLAASVAAGSLVWFENAAHAAGIIKNPGDHPDYSVELEPHALLDWDQRRYAGDTGFGVGMHAAVPFVHNGPISKINNNIGIGFGLDWSHFEDDCAGGWYWNGPGPGGNWWNGLDCTGNELTFPVYMQWNFFFTEIVSVSAEAGFSIVHSWIDIDNCGFADCSDSSTGAQPYFQGAGRFLFGETVGLMVRVGYPFLTVGATFLL